MKAIKLIAIGLIITFTQTLAQTGLESGTRYGIGEDSIRCIRNLSLYSEDFRNNNINDAWNSWIQVLDECPAAHVNIYIDGINMVRQRLGETRDPAKFEELYQLLMRVYDQRMEHFGDHPRVPTPIIKGNKALDMLRYKRNDNQVLREAYVLLDESINELKRRSQVPVLATYMSSSVQLYRMGELTAEDLVKNYTTVSEIVDFQLRDQSFASQHETLNTVKESVESLFVNSGAANCEVIEKLYAPQLEENKYDLSWLRRVNQLLARGLCEDSELLYQVSEYQHNIEPSGASAYGLARMHLKARNFDRAIEYFGEAIELTEDDNQRGEYLHQLAQIHLSKGNYPASRRYALRAIDARPNWGAPFMTIGRAYAAAADQVGNDDFEKKAVYWAAVDKFMRAKSVDSSFESEANSQIRAFSEHFPATEEIFFRGLEAGATYTVGGWINERTTVRTR
ncbi:tetratricopeptide repeat protein [Natronoflexus pectinivorans]|uniref:Tetratricopeptide repeat protein n=1 Tax=Natronoflexus pectinivorans TaxID=682526 RepID=A0A4V2RVN0_9BACT|nr:tetratricopeptide repeat protein [Natronoflexus pectinivorans]TCO04944.1 tetratricopeptide repeat protein [Natronoflexus pectinivorans]